MKLINMQMDQEEASEYSQGSVASDAPKYPYGLSISLDDGSLSKLAMDQLPRVGDTFMVMAKVQVSNVSERQNMSNDSEASVGLQITDMAIEKPFEAMDAEKALYGN